MADIVHYKELGLVNTEDMFKKAMAGGYAIPAYNFNNMEQLQGIIIGCAQSKSPVILQVSGSGPCIWITAIPLSWPNPVSIPAFPR
jgi:fructose-bisphosphate aldolase class II